MTKALRSTTVISARVSPDTKASFVALATRHRLSESRLLATMVHEVIQSNSSAAVQPEPLPDAGDACGSEDVTNRITLRLRPGDRPSVARRAHARGMKTSSYLALLIHNHVRASSVLPTEELAQIKLVSARLAALGRQLSVFGMTNNLAASAAEELTEAMALVRQEIESAREATAAIVRRNLISWETGDGRAHA